MTNVIPHYLRKVALLVDTLDLHLEDMDSRLTLLPSDIWQVTSYYFTSAP